MTSERLQELAVRAWKARGNARTFKTAVGAAVLSAQGGVHAGANLEHRFRSHDIHAEPSALAAMAAAGEGPAVAVVIAADRDFFTPCGACLDWIFELGGPECAVAFSSAPGAQLQVFSAGQLMPHYPR